MFKISGKNGIDCIKFNAVNVVEQGYNAPILYGNLDIVAGCLEIHRTNFNTSIWDLQSLKEGVVDCINQKAKSTEYSSEELSLDLAFNELGHVHIKGEFIKYGYSDNDRCKFSFDSDITCLRVFVNDINACAINKDYFLNEY